jgi:hypothetical protein
MKTYRGVVKGNTVVLQERPDAAEGAEALVLIKSPNEEEQEIVQRQKAMLEEGFPMGRLLYLNRGELHGRE